MSNRESFVVSARTSAMLLAFTCVFTGLMAAVYVGTRTEIAKSAQKAKLDLIADVLPPQTFDNALLEDYTVLPASPELGLGRESRIYRARRADAPVALVFEAAAPDGYSGHIGLLIALRADGRISGVRVTEHKETPGLGDYIDPRKDKSKTRPWISQFTDQSLEARPLARWRVKKDGGDFDYMTGATISARAVTQAVARAVAFIDGQRDTLFTAPTPSTP